MHVCYEVPSKNVQQQFVYAIATILCNVMTEKLFIPVLKLA